MPDTPTITHHADRQRYSLIIDGVEAYLTYERPREVNVEITHTIVPKAIGGRGLGKYLVARIMEDIIAADETVSSSCWYATAKIEENAHWAARLK